MNTYSSNKPIDLFASDISNGKLLRYASQNSLDESSQKQSKSRDRPPYRNQHHPQKALEVLNTMRIQNFLCDVILVVNDVEANAHKCVLAACSPYFYAMFANFEEKKLDRVVIKDIDFLAIELLIEYMYTSEILVTENNVQSLLPASNLLELSAVRDACCDFLESQLHPTNCLGIHAFADLYRCLNLLTQSEAYIEQHFSEVVESEEFLALPVTQVIQLIQSDKLIVPFEEEVQECVLNWVKHDLENREIHLPLLMEHVRLPLTSVDYILQRVIDEPLLRNNVQCAQYLFEALKYQLAKGEQKSSLKSVRTTPRQANNLKAFLVVGGQAPKAIRSVECFDLKEQKWHVCSGMPSRRCRAGVVLLDNKVYAVGGFNGSLRVKTVDLYDIQTNTWAPGIPMKDRRSTLGVAVLREKIYAVGGFDGTIGLETAEVFDPATQKWNPIASMSSKRSSVGVGVLNNLLYAVGGYDGSSRQCLSSVEYYNPDNDMWYKVADMTCKRSGAGVGVLDGVLYAVGGHDGPVVRKTVEAYDSVSDTWKSVANMSLCRRNAGVVSYNGLLYVVGGDDGSSSLSSVEVYCAKTNTWTLLTKSMSIGRSYAGVSLIDKPLNFL
ncbi:hypothetical protein PGB90_010248 [Kerria lacca]